MDRRLDQSARIRSKTEWWESFYDDAMMLVLADQSTSMVRQQVDRMISIGQFASGSSIVDQCCGLGQHAIELATRGYRVTGVDQSDLYIQMAREQAAQQGVSVEFQFEDAMAFVASESVDGVVNWHSSFGYLRSDHGNRRMLVAAFQSLKPGGRMLLEFPNMAYLMRNFRKTIRTSLPGGGTLTRYSRIRLRDGMLQQKWVYRLSSGEIRRHQSLLRIYLPHQLIRMMLSAGFKSATLFSGEGATLSADDARCIVLAHKGA